MENTTIIENTNTPQETTPKRGGFREGSGRPKSDRKSSITIRLSEAHDTFLRMHPNISQFVSEMIEEYCKNHEIVL